MAREDYWIGEVKENAIKIILKRVAGKESVRSILDDSRDRKELPSRKTFHEWLAEDTNLSDQYARACELRADAIFDEMIEIADDGRNDFMIKTLGDGVDIQALNAEHIQRSRLRIDARKWMLSKMNPKKYGDRIHQEHSGDLGITWNEEKSYE